MKFTADHYLKRALLVFIASVFAVACSQESDQGGDPDNQNNTSVTPAVEAVQARYGSLPLSERLSGTVIAKNQVELYSEISGRIEEVLVNNGDEVSKGDPLVRHKR
ncbi:MAG: efflux RND transporter periplasmic adaptor subunit [Balneolaceae bacterium]|nr:efflux RND transporter periplasmic adaptor subunit [Balneolaceae bacterium]